MTIAFNCRDGRYEEFPQAQDCVVLRETFKAKLFFNYRCMFVVMKCNFSFS